MDPALAHKLTKGFDGGMGSKQYTCGVVTGSSNPEEVENKAKTKSLTADFIEAFKNRQGSSGCRDLLDMSLDDAREQDLFASVGIRCVRVAAEQQEQIL